MSAIKFTEDHEWIRVEDDGTAVVGITDYAQDQLGELVFVELPEAGTTIDRGAEAAVIESVKAAGDVKSPASGTITEVNEALADAPETVNQDPLGDGWFFRIELSDASEVDALMAEDEYQTFVDGL